MFLWFLFLSFAHHRRFFLFAFRSKQQKRSWNRLTWQAELKFIWCGAGSRKKSKNLKYPWQFSVFFFCSVREKIPDIFVISVHMCFMSHIRKMDMKYTQLHPTRGLWSIYWRRLTKNQIDMVKRLLFDSVHSKTKSNQIKSKTTQYIGIGVV